MRLRFLLLALPLALTACSGPSISTEQSAQDLQAAVREAPNNPVVHYNHGVALLAEKRYAEALGAFDRSTHRDPHFALGHFGAHVASYLADDSLHVVARKGLSERSTPADSAAYRRVEAANVRFQQAIAYDPFVDWSLATLLLGQGERASGIDAYFMQQAIREFFGGFEAFVLGDYAEADEELSYTISLVPEYQDAYVIRGQARARLGRYAEAVEDFQHVAGGMEEEREEELRPFEIETAELHYLSGHAHLRAGDRDRAMAAFIRAAEERFDFAMAHVEIARLHEGAGDLGRALQSYDAALLAGPADGVLHFYRGTVLYQMGRLDEAVAAFERASELAPGYAPPYLNAGVALEKLGRGSDAKRSFQRFLDNASPVQYGPQMEAVRTKIAS